MFPESGVNRGILTASVSAHVLDPSTEAATAQQALVSLQQAVHLSPAVFVKLWEVGEALHALAKHR